MKRIPRTLFLLLLSLVCSVRAGEVTTTIKHIATDAIYLDAGRADSLQVGDRVSIKREDKLIAFLEVVFVADHSASCRWLEGTGTVQVGDVALVQTQRTAETPERMPSVATTDSAVTTSKMKKKSVRTNRLTGRISVASNWDNDLEITNADAAEPSLNLRTRLENIGGSAHSFDLKLRLRRVVRGRKSAAATETQWNNRLYEASLSYDDPGAKLGYRAGRFVANAIAGIGYVDGLLGSYRLAPAWSAGAFLGTNPDLRNTNFQSDQMKSGAFLRYEERGHAGQFAGTLALAGQYQDGEASREFLYQQITARPVQTLRVYESAELNINRGWHKEADGSLLLSSFILSTTWIPAQDFSADLGYDNRRNFHTFETRTVADSLFDDALRQSIRAGARWRFLPAYYARAALGVRGLADDFSDASNWSATLGSLDLFRSHCSGDANFSAYRSGYSKGNQISATLRRMLSRSLQASAAIGQDRYEITSVQSDVTQNWVRFNADVNARKHYFAAAGAELRRGEGVDGNFYSAEIGYRF